MAEFEVNVSAHPLHAVQSSILKVVDAVVAWFLYSHPSLYSQAFPVPSVPTAPATSMIIVSVLVILERAIASSPLNVLLLVYMSAASPNQSSNPPFPVPLFLPME